jgi:hypothetical protein
MNRSLLAMALSGAFFACSVPAASARDNDRGWYDDYGWERNRSRRNDGRYGDSYGYNGRYRNSGIGVVDRTMSDLRRVASRNRIDGHERDHIRNAMSDLQRLRSRFDDGRLRSAIENLEHLANANQIHPNDRRMLARDMNELRSLRYGRGYGY